MKDRYRVGGLYKVISEHGEEKVGPGVLLGIHEPYTLNEDAVHYVNHWYLSVLHGNRVQYYNTSTWTLIPLDPDSCNP
jgi:hypothetical protein